MQKESIAGINAQTESILTEYLDFPTLPFAVMLTGEWGVGKTHFTKNFFNTRKERNTDNCKELICYISLFGINTPEEIHKKVFSELIANYDSKFLRFSSLIPNIASTISFSMPFVKFETEDLSNGIKSIVEKLISKNSIIYIFDDFERCKIDSTLLLGVINSYVGNEKSKVIIITNAEKLCPENQPETIPYQEIKEKVVGMTLSIQPDWESAFSYITKKATTDEQAQKILMENHQIIFDIFTQANIQNLRMIEKIVYEFLRIYGTFDEEMKNNAPFMCEFIKCHSSCSLFHHYDQNNYKFINIMSWLMGFSGESELGLLGGIIVNSPLPRQFWDTFYESGSISNDIKFYYSNTYHPENKEAPLILGQLFNIESDEILEQNIQKLNTDLVNKNYHEIGMILLAFSVKLHLAHERMITTPSKDIVTEAKEYIDSTIFDESDLINFKESLQIEKSGQNQNHYGGFYQGCQFYNGEQNKFDNIVDMIEDKRKNTLNTFFPKKLYELIKPPFDKDFYSNITMLCHNCAIIPTNIEFIDLEELTTRFCELQGHDIYVAMSMVLESIFHNFDRNNYSYKQEWFQKFLASLETQYRKEQSKIKKYKIQYSIYHLRRKYQNLLPDSSRSRRTQPKSASPQLGSPTL